MTKISEFFLTSRVVKRFLTISVPLAAALAIIFMSASCEKYILPKIELGQDSLFFAAAADSAIVTVTSNVDWTVSRQSGDATFCTFSPDKGSENGQITFRVKDATKDLAECTVEISSEIICKSIYIRQSVQQSEE